MHRHLLLAAALLVAMADSRAEDNCAQIRAGIEAKIRAGGTTNFSLTTVASETHANGKVVGSCDRGAMKIVYLQAAASPGASAPASATPVARARERIVTECRDGSVSVGGDCSK